VKGFEIDASQALDLGRYGTLNVSAFADLVKNKADHPDSLRAHNDGEYLPNMPTNRYGANLQWQREGWKAQLSSTYYDTQKYLGRNVSEEVPLDAFNLVDLQVSRELPVRNSYIAGMEVFVNGSNLLNQEARPHNSPLKYIAPLPGRGFQVGVTVSSEDRTRRYAPAGKWPAGVLPLRVAPHAPVDSPSAKEESVMNWKHAVSLALLLSVSSAASAASAITYDKDGRYGYR
jgi:hypothetical protein